MDHIWNIQPFLLRAVINEPFILAAIMKIISLKCSMHMVCKSMQNNAIDIGGLSESLKRKFRVAMNHSNAFFFSLAGKNKQPFQMNE